MLCGAACGPQTALTAMVQPPERVALHELSESVPQEKRGGGPVSVETDSRVAHTLLVLQCMRPSFTSSRFAARPTLLCWLRGWVENSLGLQNRPRSEKPQSSTTAPRWRLADLEMKSRRVEEQLCGYQSTVSRRGEPRCYDDNCIPLIQFRRKNEFEELRVKSWETVRASAQGPGIGD